MTQAPADYLNTSSPYNYEQPLPAVARANSITQVPPTKKITFFKSGDPQFGGVKMAINPRSFKSFNALMDDLSHRVPLPFGVRTITTPRGIHCISALDQLENGGCYLCSDKKYTKPFSIGTGRRIGPQWNGRPASALRRGGQEGRREDHSRPFSQQGPKILKKITLVKNGDIGVRRSIILNHRNARSFKTLLDEISELLQFMVKKLYTVDGKKVSLCDTWHLLFIPNYLVLFMPYKANLLAPEKAQNTAKPVLGHCDSGQSSGSPSAPECNGSSFPTPPTTRAQHASRCARGQLCWPVQRQGRAMARGCAGTMTVPSYCIRGTGRGSFLYLPILVRPHSTLTVSLCHGSDWDFR
uniref:Doublecortin domain-containing protein n=1 Tax=Chelydra serpentina TaxID=8475 RepID=A0A8C3XVK0_CHESE